MSSHLSTSRIISAEWATSDMFPDDDDLYDFEQAAYFTQTSVSLIEKLITLGILEPIGNQLCRQDLVRVVKIQRLRHDLGVNAVGAAMMLDMAEEITRLKAQLQTYRILDSS